MPVGSAEFTERLLQAVIGVQSQWIAGRTAGEVFDLLLQHLIDATDSEYGYIGEVATDDEGHDFLLAHSLTDISWDAESKALVDQARLGGGFAFRNLDTLYGEVLKTAAPVIANDAPNDPRAGGTAPGHLPLERFLGLPLFADDDLVGSVGLANRPGGYDQGLVDAIEPLVVTCGTIIAAFRERQRLEASNAQLEELAQTLRESLLPPALPSIGWLDVAARFRAATDGQGVLGDFYDVFQTVPGRWFFIVGDVRGHGPQAAKTTALSRWTLQARATTTSDPAALLEDLNLQLLGRRDEDAPHVTAVVVVVDLADNASLDPMTVSVATAGHPPPIIRHKHGSVSRLEPSGTILGAFEDAGIVTRKVELRPGESLLLFTDGVTEARHRDLLVGEKELAEALATAPIRSAQDVVDVAMDVSTNADGAIDDDAAVVVLRVPT